MRCDIKDCNNRGTDHLGKWIKVCGNHWFSLMNGLEPLPKYLKDIEAERKKIGKPLP